MLFLCMQGWPTVGLACLEAGVLDLALATWREHSPIDFISGARTTAALVVGSAVKEAIDSAQTAGRDISAVLVDSGYIDCCISALRAFELQGNTDGISSFGLVYGILWPLIIVEGEAYDRVNELIRGAVSSLAFVLEHDMRLFSALDFTSGPFTCMVSNCPSRTSIVVSLLRHDREAAHCRSWRMRLAAKSPVTSRFPKTTSTGVWRFQSKGSGQRRSA